MYKLFVHKDAEQDLEALWDTDQTAYGQIYALLEELEGGNQDLLDRLTQHDFGARQDADIHVSKWFEQWNQDKNLWRLKLWPLERKGIQYRVVYAFMPRTSQYHVLAVAPRDFNYEANHDLTKRIVRAYSEL